MEWTVVFKQACLPVLILSFIIIIRARLFCLFFNRENGLFIYRKYGNLNVIAVLLSIIDFGFHFL